MNMGRDFIKKIGPLGMALIIIFGVLSTYMMFTADLGVPPRYRSLHETEYYRQSGETMEQLHDELREHVFPAMDGILESAVLQDSRQIRIRVNSAYYDRVKSAILRDFDEILFEFQRSPV